MNKHVTFALLLMPFLLATPLTSAAATPAPGCIVRGLCGGLDGVWWQRLPKDAKLPVVQGMIASYQSAFDLGQFDLYSSYLTAYKDDHNAAASAAFHRGLSRPIEDGTFSKSAATYVAAIDHFYATYPSKLMLNVAEVMRCLMDKPMFSCDYVGKFDQGGLLPWPTGP